MGTILKWAEDGQVLYSTLCHEVDGPAPDRAAAEAAAEEVRPHYRAVSVVEMAEGEWFVVMQYESKVTWGDFRHGIKKLVSAIGKDRLHPGTATYDAARKLAEMVPGVRGRLR